MSQPIPDVPKKAEPPKPTIIKESEDHGRTMCFWFFHNFSKWQDYENYRITIWDKETQRNIEKEVRLTQMRVCRVCGLKEFTTHLVRYTN